MKRRRNPPPRLEWPAPGPLSLSNQNPIPASSGSFQKQFHDIKRSTIKKQFTIKKHREALHKIDNDNMMWIEKYAFIDDAKDLCVQNRKVDEVRTWMKSALRACYRSSADYTRNVDDNVSKLLLLVGSPGIGKSTMCRVLAKELGLDLLEWNDATTSTSTSCSYSTYGADNSLLSSSYQSPLSSFEEFLQSAGTGCNSLDLSSSVYQNEEKRIENTSSKKGAMLFIEDMPNLHSSDAEKKFKHTMEQHIHTSRFPTILIFSNVSEGKAAPSDLEKLIPSSVLYNSNKVKIIQCNSVTQSKMKKCLGMIAQKERIFIPNGLLELIHTNSGGDLRNAIMTLQFQLVGRNQYSSRVQMKNPKRITNLHETNNNAIKRGAQFDRDVKLSAFHALGKLLYAKRQINTNKDTGSFHSSERPPLQFIPEEVVNSCDMSLEGMVSFLSYHCPDFYTSEMDLSEAFELFSDTVLLLDRTYDPQRDQSDKTFPSAYISSLAGRTVAYTNKNPTPNKFRSLEAPKVYDVLRKKKWNDIKINQLCKRLSLSVETSGNNEEEEYSNSMLPLNASIGSSSRFVTDYLPFMRIIHPNVINHALNNLYSIDRIVNKSNGTNQNETANDEINELGIKEQNEILFMDDIMDYEDDNDDDNDDKNDALIRKITKYQGKIRTDSALPSIRKSNTSFDDNNTNEIIIIDDDDDDDNHDDEAYMDCNDTNKYVTNRFTNKRFHASRNSPPSVEKLKSNTSSEDSKKTHETILIDV